MENIEFQDIKFVRSNDDKVGAHDIYFITPRSCMSDWIVEDGVLILEVEFLETEEEWLKRCGAIENIRLEA